jgi:transposase-like protein
VTSSKGGISALELQRQLGFRSYGTAWTWLHKIRRAMVDPDRRQLDGAVEADETLVGGRKSGKRGRGAAGETVVAGAIEAAPGETKKRALGRLRLEAVASAAGADLERFITTNVAERGAITTDGWRGYGGLEAAGYDHHAIDLARSWGEADQRLPAVHLVFGLAERWLLGTHHGAVGGKYLQRYLDEFVFRFNRRRAKSPAHGFARVLQHAVRIPPATHREIVAAGAT